jgi:uncharacterized protein YegL
MAVTVVPQQRRPYPVVFLVDTSGSMADDGKIVVLNEALKGAISLLASINDPELELWCAIISFGSQAELRSGLAPIEQISLPPLQAKGGSVLGEALHELAKLFPSNSLPMVPHPPALVLISDGQPTDEYQATLSALEDNEWFRLSLRLAIRIGPDCDEKHLRSFTGAVSAVFTVSELVTLPDVMVRGARAIHNEMTLSSSSTLADT